ncbi:uncharacterized protein GGS22DRAFT_159895 [Annulohypoxylon maeteangense]|uniref:uncharacterized protein n=1 Tax=Annulohypoxylon maeteangense TaxID=1927788 RepID=UPI002008A08C|nr:uncharacterized protein GGS22DRAFT_159895 [Annulohypoxylon maeteangense]KAI0886103.1 hypothetical protein GGS22DRAFT_159895 [Annulohypoxylon maeteangense]
MASRIPPLLDTYLRQPPETSLILLSGVLGSTTNWLVLRYLYSLLSIPSDRVAGQDNLDVHKADDTSVVLVSFLRDYSFWKEGAGKLGIDLDALARKAKFVFIDGLADIFHKPQTSTTKRSPEITSGKKVLSGITLQLLNKELGDAISSVQRSSSEQKTVLIIDHLDLLLAASGGEVSSPGLQEMLLGIREKVHSCIITIAADEPLISPQATPLEKEHAALAISLAHDAYYVISLRMLNTGTARDVSGVVRVTSGGGNNDIGRAVEEQELLYFITNDGGVRVFVRG